MQHYKDTLIKVQTHRNNIGKPLEELISLPESVQRISVSTANNQIGTISSFLDWAEKNGYVDKNYAEGISYKQKRLPNSERAAFTNDDLTAIFTPVSALSQPASRPGIRCLFGLFTGARLEELSQLHVSYVQNDAEDKEVKTPSSVRKVPLQDFVIKELRFAKFVEDAQTGGEKRLFPDLKRVQGQTGRSRSGSKRSMKALESMLAKAAERTFTASATSSQLG